MSKAKLWVPENVRILNPTAVLLQCTLCGQQWSPQILPGGKISQRSRYCPNGYPRMTEEEEEEEEEEARHQELWDELMALCEAHGFMLDSGTEKGFECETFIAPNGEAITVDTDNAAYEEAIAWIKERI